MAELKQIWRKRLGSEGVHFVEKVPDEWSTDAEATYILCPGRKLRAWLPRLRLAEEGGELGLFETNTPLDILMSGGGFHIGPMDPQTVVVGATRWTGDPAQPPEQALLELSRKGKDLWPDLGPGIQAWRGVRCVHPGDRLPIAGAIPGHARRWLLGALGSKGLLWGPLAARALVEAICHDSIIPEALSTDRLDPETLVLQHP